MVFPLTEAPSLPASALVLIAARLGVDRSSLETGVLASEYAFAAAQIVIMWPCISDPATLTYPDTTFFERAAGLIVASRLFGPLTSGEGGILIKLTTADGTSEAYSAPPSASAESWLAEAKEAALNVGCIRASLATSASKFSLLTVGRTRTERLLNLPAGAITERTGLYGLLDYGSYPLGSYTGAYGGGYG